MSFGVTEPNGRTDTSRSRRARSATRPLRRQRPQGVEHQRPARDAHSPAGAHRARDPATPFAGMTLFFTEFDRADRRPRDREARRAAIDSNEIFIDGSRFPRRTSSARWAGLLPSARLAEPRARLHRIEAVGIGRAALDRACSTRRSASSSTADRPEPGDRPSARARVGEARVAGLMCLKAAWLFDSGRPCGAESNTAKLLGPRRASKRATSRCRPRRLRLREGVLTSSGSGARCASTRSRRCRSRWSSHISEHVLGLPKSY